MNAFLPIALGAALLIGFGASPAFAGEASCSARSPDHTVALLELFTSEGCSSCPPADRWLSGLAAADGLSGKVVPLALHVDYWDYIGWKDSYAQPGFAARQRRQAMHAGNALVYTPQFFLQGRPYRPPASVAAFGKDLDSLRGHPPRADIALNLEPVANGKLTAKIAVRLRQGETGGSLALFVALYENGLSSRVAAGENRGATLRHDFVVRRWIGPQPLPAAGSGERTISFAVAPEWQVRNLGVAAFVQDTQRQDVLQALAHPACG